MLDTLPVALLVAVAIDLLIGDPVSRWHPVALFGRAVGWLVDRAPRVWGPRQYVYGAAAVGVSVGGVATLGALVLRALEEAAPLAAVAVGGALLKASFSYRQLEHEALVVAAEIEAGHLIGARGALRSLVSRDTAGLSENLAASAAVESLAENLCDSVVAPICFFLLWGVPGALAYRAINTWDAMVGYHGPYEYLGRAAARLDDIANLVPARLTAVLLVVAAALTGADVRGALAGLWHDRRRTESPNAGWSMGAMAGALRARLEKPGHYTLGGGYRPCSAADIHRAVRVARAAVATFFVVSLGITLVLGARLP